VSRWRRPPGRSAYRAPAPTESLPAAKPQRSGSRSSVNVAKQTNQRIRQSGAAAGAPEPPAAEAELWLRPERTAPNQQNHNPLSAKRRRKHTST
jgi:hypothetical protein